MSFLAHLSTHADHDRIFESILARGERQATAQQLSDWYFRRFRYQRQDHVHAMRST